MVDQQRGALIEVERRAPGGVTGEVDRALAEDERTAIDAAVEHHVLGVGDGKRTGAVLLDGVELIIRRTARSGELRPRQGDISRTGEVELALLRVLLDATKDRQIAAGRCADGGVDGHADGADVGIITGNVLEDAAEINTAEELVIRGTRAERIVNRDAAAELQRRANRGGIERDGGTSRTGGGGVAEVDRAVVDREAAREIIGASQRQDRDTFLGQAEGAADLLDGARNRDRVSEIESRGGIQVDWAGKRTAESGATHRAAAGKARTGDPNGVRNRALDIERGGIGSHHQRLARRGAERIDAAEHEGAGREGDVAGEG